MGNEEKKNQNPSIKKEMAFDLRTAAIAGPSFGALQAVNRTASPITMNVDFKNSSRSDGFENEGLPAPNDRNLESELDLRRMKRYKQEMKKNTENKIISNRASAQKSRLKKLQYVVDMEKKVKALEAHIAMLSPQVALYKNQKQKLQMENNSLTQQISAIARIKKLKDAQIEENKAEANRLRQVHLKQCYDHYLPTQSMKFNWETPLLDQIRGSFGLADTHGNHETVERRREAKEGGSQPEATARQGRRAVQYKWMPTPGLPLISKPSSSNHQAGSPKMMVNLNSDPE